MKRLIGLLFALAIAFCASETHAQAANVSISFSPTSIAAGGETSLHMAISNPSSVSTVTGGSIASFSYAVGVTNASNPGVFFFGCGASAIVNAVAGAGSMSASGIDVLPFQTCDIFITVTAASGGSYTSIFPVGGFSGSTGSNSSSSSATLVVNELVVTNTNDSGAGSLRQAIATANANCSTGGPSGITFNIPGSGTRTIQPTSALPALGCAAMTVNGFTQPGAAANNALSGFDNAVRVIAVDGSLCASCDGFTITAGAVTLQGLQVSAFNQSGVVPNDSTFGGSIVLKGNLLASNLGGAMRLQNGFVLLGDGTAAGQNLVSSNAGGVIVQGGDLIANRNIVDGNAGYGFDFSGAGGEVISSIVRGSPVGIRVTTLQDVVIQGTACYNVTSLPRVCIDLNGDGATANDEASLPYDTDSGPNELLNTPIVESVQFVGSDTVVTLHLKTVAGNPATIELWDNSTVGVYEGQTLLSTFVAPLDANGFFSGSVTITGVLAGAVSAKSTIDTCGDGCVVSSEFSISVAAAVANLVVSPATLTFAQQRVGTTSAPQTVTLTNTGSAAVNFSSIATSADFVKSTTCTATLAPSTSCTVDVSFSPSSGGNITGTLTIQSDAPGSPHTVSLSGAGVVAPSVTKSFNPSSILVGGISTLAFTISNPNTVPVTNLSISDNYPSGIVNAPVVNASNTCSSGSVLATPGVPGHFWSGIGVPANGSCVVSVDVKANASGVFNNQIPVGSMASDQGGNTSVIQATLTVTAAAAPAVSLSPASIDFGSVNVGTTSATQDIVITNTGDAPLTISTATVTAEFVRAATPRCDGVVLSPAQTCTEKVAFAPTVAGPASGTWSVFSDAAGSPHSVSLTGQGVAVPSPAATLSPTSLTFADQTVGTTSAPQTVTLTNTGNANLVISSIVTTGDFGQSNRCPGTLNPGASCSIAVTFTPLVTGGRVGQLRVSDNASGSPHVVNLSGNGIPNLSPTLTLSPGSLSFPDTFVGTGSAAQVVTVSNTGTGPLAIGTLTSSSAQFTFSSGCDGSTLPPGTSCQVAVEFHPSAVGPQSGAISIPSNASGSPHTIPLSGTGISQQVGVLSVAPSSLAFPNSTVVGSQSAALTLTLTNTGSATITVANISISANFTFTGACVTLAPGASCPLSVRFAPTQLGNLTGTLTIQSDATVPLTTVPLSGRAVATPEPIAALSATSLGFGNRLMGAPSTPQVVTLTNTGSGVLNLAGIFATGDFNQTNTCAATLPPAASCQITVRMFARLTGARLGTVQVFSNAPGSPAIVQLAGTGCRFPSLALGRLGISLTCVPGS